VEIDSPINGEYPARHQPALAGSSVRFSVTQKLEDIQSFTALVLIWPTTPGKGEQALVSCWSAHEDREFGVFSSTHGGVELRIGDSDASAARLICDKPLIEREWSLVVTTFDAATGKAGRRQRTQNLMAKYISFPATSHQPFYQACRFAGKPAPSVRKELTHLASPTRTDPRQNGRNTF